MSLRVSIVSIPIATSGGLGSTSRVSPGARTARASRRRAWAYVLCLAAFLTVALFPGVASGQGRGVQVGIYQNKPKIFTDGNGKPSGMLVGRNQVGPIEAIVPVRIRW